MTCDPETPLHFHGHIAISRRVRLPNGVVVIGFICVGCGKRSKTWTPIKENAS